MFDLEPYVRAEIKAIRTFKRSETLRLGRRLTSNEAAERWLDEQAEDFRTKYFGVSDGQETLRSHTGKNERSCA